MLARIFFVLATFLLVLGAAQARTTTPCPNPVQCFVDPCTTAKCKNFPNAECRSNYCGGCNAEFFVGCKKVDCG